MNERLNYMVAPKNCREIYRLIPSLTSKNPISTCPGPDGDGDRIRAEREFNEAVNLFYTDDEAADYRFI